MTKREYVIRELKKYQFDINKAIKEEIEHTIQQIHVPNRDWSACRRCDEEKNMYYSEDSLVNEWCFPSCIEYRIEENFHIFDFDMSPINSWNVYIDDEVCFIIEEYDGDYFSINVDTVDLKIVIDKILSEWKGDTICS